MSRNLEDYRSVQIDIRAIEMALGAISDEEKSHPDKATGHDSLAEQAKWGKIKGEFDRRKAYLRKQLAAKEEQKANLYSDLSQTPLSMQSLAHVIDMLTCVEAYFATEGANKAWDSLSGIIDALETDKARVTKLEAVAA